ncbi:MAG: efflux RND transporter periplasmic adaptor subunit [Acidobacteriota bacterium]
MITTFSVNSLVSATTQMRQIIRTTQTPAAVLLLFLGIPAPLSALQPQPPPSPVRYTEARTYPLKKMVQLPGTVEALRVSTVASEVAGLVVEFTGRDGTRVAKDQPLARLRKDTLELALRAAEAQLHEDEARVKLAERNLQRAQDLFKSRDFSQSQLDDAQAEFNAWQARIEKQDAEIARIRHDLERTVVRAPFSGVVVREHTEVGQWLAEGGPVVELLGMDELEVAVEVPERYFSSLRPGARCQARFEALGGLEVTGRIASIIPRADPQARTFRIKVRIPNSKTRIGAGMLAQIALPEGDPYQATVVPKDAIVTQGPQKFVFLLNGNNTVSQVPVETGSGVGAWIEVLGPVQSGQKVVTRGNERLFPGQPVQGQVLEVPLP